MIPESMSAAVARIQAIQTTITGQAPLQARAADSLSPEAFQVMLNSIVGSDPTSSLAALGGNAKSGLTPVAGAVKGGPPPGFEGFANGELPEAFLGSVIGSAERLWAPAAQAFNHMATDAARQGIDLTVVDGYRPINDQHRLAEELGLYRDGGKAAVPGTSEHGWGRALDLETDDATVAWLRSNAWKYGFIETVPREPWHWEFHPA